MKILASTYCYLSTCTMYYLSILEDRTISFHSYTKGQEANFLPTWQITLITQCLMIWEDFSRAISSFSVWLVDHTAQLANKYFENGTWPSPCTPLLRFVSSYLPRTYICSFFLNGCVCLESSLRVSTIVDYSKFPTFVHVSVMAFHCAIVITFFVSKLAIFSENLLE